MNVRIDYLTNGTLSLNNVPIYCTCGGKSDPGLELPTERVTGLGCIPEGRNVSYQCTLLDDGSRSTVWLGSAFNCPSSNNQITLPHPEYSTPVRAMGICGGLSAMSVNFTAGVEYTSRLTFTATAALNGTVIECALPRRNPADNDTIKIGGWLNELSVKTQWNHPCALL